MPNDDDDDDDDDSSLSQNSCPTLNWWCEAGTWSAITTIAPA